MNNQNIEIILNKKFFPALMEKTDFNNFYYDSRLITNAKQALFLAIKREFRDGHDYIVDAYKKGIRYFIISNYKKEYTHLKKAHFIQVDNVIEAFQKIVKKHREQYDFPIIAITGSNGKTIIKEWLFQILHEKYKIIRSPKSYNSQLGVPLSLLLLNENYNLGIFEVGISQKGEMHKLENIVQPDIGVLAHFGDAHEENFENPLEKLEEKLLLFKNIKNFVYKNDDNLVTKVIKNKIQSSYFTNPLFKSFSWGKSEENDLQIVTIEKSAQKSIIKAKYKGEIQIIQIPFTDDASIENAIYTLATLCVLGKNENIVLDNFKKLYAIKMRLEKVDAKNNCILFNDSYNSDLSSIKIALNHLRQQNSKKKKTVILSDLQQIPSKNGKTYEQIAQWIKERNIHRFIGIGPHLYQFQSYFKENNNLETYFFLDTSDCLKQLNSISFHDEYILLKGSRKFSLEKIKKQLELKLHRTYLEIHLDAIRNNFSAYKALLKPQTKIMGMVKAEAYGSGSFELALNLQEMGADYLAVAYIDEGIALKKKGIYLPIMVMNPDIHSLDRMIAWNLEPEIYSLEILDAFLEQLKSLSIQDYPIHIKLDTGMHRLGFAKKDWPLLKTVLLDNKNHFYIKSIFSHLVGSDQESFDAFTIQQAHVLKEAIADFQQVLEKESLVHILNSSGIIRHPELQMDMVRLGIGLYGIDPSNTMPKSLERAIFLKTTIAQIKEIKKGEGVGYNLNERVSKNSKIATINIGYADGYLRSLGNHNAKVFIHGKYAPIIGNICMDMCMIDISHIEDISIGDEVEVFGNNISIEDLAQKAKTIPYEILTGISSRIPRVYIQTS